jgi:HEAT repeat protein
MYAQIGLLALPLLGLVYWAWDRHRRPSVPTYEGKALAEWVADLNDLEYLVSDRAAEALAHAGADAVPVLLEAREKGEIRLHRRAAAVLVRIGAPAAPGLVGGLKDGPNDRVEVALVRMGPNAVPALVDALKEEKKAREAARVLGLMGPRGAAGAPALIETLKKPRGFAGLREEAAAALGRIGTPVEDIVPVLVAALKDDNAMVRQRAAESLGWIGPPARAAVPALVAALKDEKPEVAGMACLAVARLGDAGVTRPLLEVFQSGRSLVADAAGRALWQMGPASKAVLPALIALLKEPPKETERVRTLLVWLGPLAVPSLAAALKDEEPAIRQAAADTLGQLGPVAREAVPALAGTLEDKTSSVALAAALALPRIDPTRARDALPHLTDSLDHAAAADALADMGPDARAAVPALLAALKHREGAVRSAAVHALACIGSAAVPALIDALKGPDRDTASRAADALGSILPPPKEAIPALREALPMDRANAAAYARALGGIGPAAREAIPELTALLTDADARPEIAVTLVRIDPGQAEKVVPALVEDLKSSEPKRQLRAINALGQLGAAAKPAVPLLAGRLKDHELQEASLAALRRIGPEASEAVPALVAFLRAPGQNIALKVGDVLVHIGPKAIPAVAGLLQDANVEYRRFAVFILAQYGGSAREALTPLMRALKDSDTQVASGAAHVLEEIGPDAREAVPALIENLMVYQSQVRGTAAVALGHIGKAAREARAPLRECLMDPDKGVRYAAALALGRIDPTNTEAVPALRDTLHDLDPEVWLAAIDSLARIDRTQIKETTPILVALSQKPYPLPTRLKAVEGLADLEPEEAKIAVPLLDIELYNAAPAVRLSAALLLERIQRDRVFVIVLAMASTLKDRDPGVRVTIAHALGMLGPWAREAVPALLPLLHDDEQTVRDEVGRSLRLIDAKMAQRLGLGDR